MKSHLPTAELLDNTFDCFCDDTLLTPLLPLPALSASQSKVSTPKTNIFDNDKCHNDDNDINNNKCHKWNAVSVFPQKQLYKQLSFTPQ